MRPPEEATKQVRNTKSVILPGYSFPPEALTTTPPAIGSEYRISSSFCKIRRGGQQQVNGKPRSEEKEEEVMILESEAQGVPYIDELRLMRVS